MAERKPYTRSHVADAHAPRPRAALYALLFTFSFLIITYNLFSIPLQFSVNRASSSSSFPSSAIISPGDTPRPAPPELGPRLEHRAYGHLSSVYCYPSYGGIRILEIASPVELDYLGLPRTSADGGRKYEDPEEEDAFCDKLLRLGAKLWKSYEDFENVLTGVRKRTDKEVERVLVGWPQPENPEVGVWVLRMPTAVEHKGIGRVHNAYTMEERCKVLEDLGAKWCSVPETCLEMFEGPPGRNKGSKE